MPKLTKRLVESIEPEATEVVVWDTEISGFGVRVSPAGRRSYILKYRAGHGRSAPIRKPTIGVHGNITLEQARAIARDMMGQVAAGRDPSAERKAEAELPTMKDLAAAYLDAFKAKRTIDEDKAKFARLEKLAPSLMRKRVRDVTHADVAAVKAKLADTPIQANRFLALLSAAFSYASGPEKRWCTENPAKGIKRNPEERRERYLSPAELLRLSEALNAYSEPGTANAVRLLMLTGARRGEVLQARWEQFDLDAGVWTKPSAHTKQKKLHRVPLSPPALLLLQAQRKLAGTSEWVFPGRRNGERLMDVKKAWATVCTAAGIEDARLHDLRHTFASILAGSGMSLPIIGALLGHTQPATTARYSHLADDPLREATGRVGALFQTGGADVIPLRGAKDGEEVRGRPGGEAAAGAGRPAHAPRAMGGAVSALRAGPHEPRSRRPAHSGDGLQPRSRIPERNAGEGQTVPGRAVGESRADGSHGLDHHNRCRERQAGGCQPRGSPGIADQMGGRSGRSTAHRRNVAVAFLPV
ncbi:integrase [Constrictibacter sp. MBR-5]|uniref:tyrosine-type recombinase/integrase n=1 Tax=Constrictibacter sp. MBR-5 TaxID=3156467 RepID=UPI003399BCAE